MQITKSLLKSLYFAIFMYIRVSVGLKILYFYTNKGLKSEQNILSLKFTFIKPTETL